MTALPLNLSSLIGKISDRELEVLSRDNPDARLETNSQGQLIFMSDSSTGFRLSNDAIRSPDVSWIPLSQWNSLTQQQRRKYLPIDPYFVIELMSPTDILSNAQSKMKEYMNCGVEFGWLINPDDRQVEIYRQGQDREVFNNPQTLSGEDIMPGLIVDLAEIFD